jgi:hypothetical protein
MSFNSDKARTSGVVRGDQRKIPARCRGVGSQPSGQGRKTGTHQLVAPASLGYGNELGSLKSRASIDSWSGRHGFPGGQPAGSLDEACLGGIDGVCCLLGVELGPQGGGPALLVAQ